MQKTLPPLAESLMDSRSVPASRASKRGAEATGPMQTTPRRSIGRSCAKSHSESFLLIRSASRF